MLVTLNGPSTLYSLRQYQLAPPVPIVNVIWDMEWYLLLRSLLSQQAFRKHEAGMTFYILSSFFFGV
jgi:hypothetical protein